MATRTASTKVFDLALANIKKSDQDKAGDSLKREVARAKHGWSTEIFGLTENVNNAKDRVEALKANVSATASDIIEADRGLALAQANLAAANEAFEARF